MDQAREAKRRYNISTIFLATYETEVLKEIDKYKEEFDFLHLSWENLSEMKNYKWNKEASSESTIRMLLEIHLLGESNLFIGAQRSMFGWLASRLIIGRVIETCWLRHREMN